MTSFALLAEQPLLWLSVVGIFGLITGSFLNVVIYRLPIMLQQSWQRDCQELLGLEKTPETRVFNLNQPGSSCPHCGHRIPPWENIPVLSFILLRGRCSSCHQAISWRYPLVELATSLLSILVAWRFGVTWASFAALVLTWALIALSLIDFDTQLLPDVIVIPVLWVGLLVNLFDLFADLPSAVVGAAIGYASLWSIYQIFKRLTGKEGMGYGDFKLFALFGAWLGWQQILPVILIASFSGAILGLGAILLQGRHRDLPIPFGPYLAFSGWIMLLWGDQILDLYLRWSGLA